MTNERLKVIIENLVKILDEELFTGRTSVDDKIDFLVEEVGMTEAEIEELNIVEECF